MLKLKLITIVCYYLAQRKKLMSLGMHSGRITKVENNAMVKFLSKYQCVEQSEPKIASETVKNIYYKLKKNLYQYSNVFYSKLKLTKSFT